MLVASPAATAKVGVTSAVLPQASGQPPGGDFRVLNIGQDIVADEKLETGPNGKAQLLFVDGSSLTVGPNSDIVVDEFVFDPNTKTGKLAFSATKGLFRLVGGKISKKTPVTIKLPTATIGIRGGIGIVNASAGGSVIGTFLFGEQMQVSGDGGSQVTRTPGRTIAKQPGQPPSPPAPTTQTQLDQATGGLESSQGQKQDSTVSVSSNDVSGSQVSNLNSSNAPSVVSQGGPGGGTTGGGGGGGADEGGPVTDAGNEGASSVRTASQQSSKDESVEQAQSSSSSSSNSSQSSNSSNSSNSGSTNTGSSLNLDSFQGLAKRSDNVTTGTLDNSTGNNFTLTSVTNKDGAFSASSNAGTFDLFLASNPGSFTVGDGNSPIATPFGDATGSGSLTSSNELIFYELSHTDASRSIVLAGDPTPENVLGSALLYNLSTDPIMDHNLTGSDGTTSFVPVRLGGIQSGGFQQIYVDFSASKAVFSGKVVIKGQESAQTLAASAIAGRVETDSSSNSLIEGHFRGTAGGISGTSFFASEVNSARNGAGGSFYGPNSPDYFLLEAADLDAANAVSSRGASRVTGATAGSLSSLTYFPNHLAARSNDGISGSASTQTLNGFVGGHILVNGTVEQFFTADTASPISSNLSIVLNAGVTDITSAQLAFKTLDNEDTVTLKFGGSDASTHVFSDRFVLLEQNSDPGSNGAGNFVTADSFLLPSAFVSFEDVLPSGVSICSCSFVDWGVFATRYAGAGGTIEQVPLAHWVASSQFANSGQFPTSRAASYTGTIMANVKDSAKGSYVSVGSVTLGFITPAAGNVRLSSIDFTNFEGLTSGAVSNGPTGLAPDYTAEITATHPTHGAVSGTLDGSFAGTGTMPENTLGHIQMIDDGMSGADFRVGGVYFAEKASEGPVLLD